MEKDAPKVRAAQPWLGLVRRFWEANPLYSLECPFPVGTPEFFAWTDQVRSEIDAFAQPLYELDRHTGDRVLDVGCGVGWLCKHFALGRARVFGADLARQAVESLRKGV